MNSVLRGVIPYKGGGGGRKVAKFPFASCLRNQKPRQFEQIGPYVDCNFPLRCFLWYVFVVSWLRITLVQFTLKLVSRGYRWDRFVTHTCFVLQKPDQLLSAAHLSSLPVFREGPQAAPHDEPVQAENFGKAGQVVNL